jgi:hypothetical protein
MTLSCDDEDQTLFHTSIEISLGNVEKTLFWHDRKASKGIAPNLFKLVRLKNRSVAKELAYRNWI